jgi:hypothetical protein
MSVKLANNLMVLQATKQAGFTDWMSGAANLGKSVGTAVGSKAREVGELIGNWGGKQVYEWSNNPQQNWAARSGIPGVSGVGRAVDLFQNVAGTYGKNRAMEAARSGKSGGPRPPVVQGFYDAAKADFGNKGTLGNQLYNTGVNARMSNIFGQGLGGWLSRLWTWIREKFRGFTNRAPSAPEVTDRPSTETVEGQ